jgi:hypothetical protein
VSKSEPVFGVGNQTGQVGRDAVQVDRGCQAFAEFPAPGSAADPPAEQPVDLIKFPEKAA